MKTLGVQQQHTRFLAVNGRYIVGLKTISTEGKPCLVLEMQSTTWE